MSLSKDSSIQDLFNHIYDPDHDVQVVPVTISKPDDDIARLMIIVQGKPNTAHHILANLMTHVQDLHDLAEQQGEAPPKDESQIIGTDGEVLGDDKPSLEIVS